AAKEKKRFRHWDPNRRAIGEAYRCSKETDKVSNNRNIYAAERQNCREKTPTKNCRSCFQKEKSDANSHYE
ncbi:24535_t:CDS:2, partial [Gigaspora margarita]